MYICVKYIMGVGWDEGLLLLLFFFYVFREILVLRLHFNTIKWYTLIYIYTCTPGIGLVDTPTFILPLSCIFLHNIIHCARVFIYHRVGNKYYISYVMHAVKRPVTCKDLFRKYKYDANIIYYVIST